MEAIDEPAVSAQTILSDEEFYAFCQRNSDLRFEREPDGKLIVMPNTGGKTGNKNSRLNAFLTFWTIESGTGIEFDSSTAFRLADGSTRSPDASWVRLDRWNALTEREQEQFPPLCPDFVIELMSATDTLSTSKTKMLDVWIANGCHLAWLIDPKAQTTHIFRANGEIQIINGFDKTLSGEDVLEGFLLDLNRLA
ncbi:MAG: Uma2 family endonuclease [Spirosoma sp.]|nr:Uma2 family endonuclease [Spirosoma sp.]